MSPIEWKELRLRRSFFIASPLRKSPLSDTTDPAPFEQGEIGPDLFEAACRMRLEGLVSKHRERTYRPGRRDHWIKVKNRKHPAFSRVDDQF